MDKQLSQFDNFLCERSDALDAAAQALFQAMAVLVEPELDVTAIAPLLDCSERILESMGAVYCRPYYESPIGTVVRVPCYQANTCLAFAAGNCSFLKKMATNP